jgi:single-strand DNA-binding protein
MGSVNKVILVGHMGRDAEYATTSTQNEIARFSLATTSRTKNSSTGEWEDKTEWHRVVLFGRQATSLKPYLKKGSLIAIDGRLQTRSWQDKDGQKRYTTEVVADRIELLGARQGGGGRGRDEEFGGGDDDAPAPADGATRGPAGAGSDDDIPF